MRTSVLIQSQYSRKDTKSLLQTNVGVNLDRKRGRIANCHQFPIPDSQFPIPNSFPMNIRIEKKQNQDIATWMQVEQPNELPEVLKGIFFMDGNGLPDYCLTMQTAEWNPRNLTLLLRVFDPIIWSFHSSSAGRMLIYLVNFARITYLFRFSDATLQHANIAIILFGWEVPRWMVDFLFARDPNTPNGDIWYRKNSFFGGPADSGYVLRRVVDKNRNQTAAFPAMLSKIGNECLIVTN
ncbi:MAG: hypothetical protein ACRC62_12220 [Microcoleus sp.]